MIDISSAHVLPTDITLYDNDGNLKFVPLINDKDGCSYWRIRKPFEAMGLDIHKTVGSLDDYFAKAKAVVFNRTPGFDIRTLIQLKQKFGFKIVIDWDDYWHLPHDHLIYKGWTSQKMPEIAEMMIKELADYVTCTTERLAEKIRPFNKNVVVIPNAIPLTETQWLSPDREYGTLLVNELTKTGNTRKKGGIRFGYVAGSSHLPDLKHIAPVLNHYPDLNLSLCGYNNPDYARGVRNVWDSMWRIASHNFHNSNAKVVKTMDFNEYAKAYESIDVAIAPLNKSPFNAHKSSLKAYEAGAKKVALIASDCAPYTDDIPRDVATFCATNAEWVDAIKAHKDPAFVKDQALKLHEWVKENRDIKKVNKVRLEFLNSI